MAMREVEITIISARGLANRNHLSESKPYVVASMRGLQSYAERESPEDEVNGTNPNWDYPITFLVEEAALLEGRLVLDVEIRPKGTFRVRNKEIGHVSIPLLGGVNVGVVEYAAYQVFKHSGKPKGILNMSVKIGERIPIYGSWYSPQFHGYHGYPPQGYASQGHPPQNQQNPHLQQFSLNVAANILIHLIIGSVLGGFGN